MKRLTPKIAAAFFAFVVEVASASLYVVRQYRSAEEVPIRHPISAPKELNHPEGWQKIDVDNKFSFYLPAEFFPPPNMKQVEMPENVEYFGPTKTFGNKTLNVRYMYVDRRSNEELWHGKVSCETLLKAATDQPSYRSMDVEIGGRGARQIVWQTEKPKLSFTTLCFSDLGDGTILLFAAFSKDERVLDVAQQIFGSIEFP
jgi:hypothetical protein